MSFSNSLYQRPRWPQAYKRLSACGQLQWATPPPRSINPRHCNHRGSHGCLPHGQEPAHTQDTQDSQQLDSGCCEVGALDVHLVPWLPRSPSGASKPPVPELGWLGSKHGSVHSSSLFCCHGSLVTNSKPHRTPSSCPTVGVTSPRWTSHLGIVCLKLQCCQGGGSLAPPLPEPLAPQTKKSAPAPP